MDLTNPLSDAHPPRYAYESDDEDEFDAPSEDVPNPTSTPEPLDFKLRSMGTLTPHESLIIASGDAGKAWVEGAELGEQQGGIYVNDIQVGLLFSRSVAGKTVTVVISEVTTTLPVHAMHQYAEFVLDQIQPSRISMIDTYSAASYISKKNIDYVNAPVRYMTSVVDPSSQILSITNFEQYDPPNMIQTTSAAFLSIVAVRSLQDKASAVVSSLILLPSIFLSRSARPALVEIIPGALSRSSEGWHEALMKDVHQVSLGLSMGSVDPGAWIWGGHSGSLPVSPRSKRAEQDGGMYI
ncbi:hypothetical protein BDV98DRAFT_576046 [Pterulicium gracile]|uniref:Proteasome assembly chaperone 1 n=1 Tax=Pterulicium gracile TaxID=1884261 RepID=A0A5C3Q3I3_9AGAR|nr:hypothetical protein BDV98DRAFT_576046 [Pterula gracilis]